MAIITQEDLLGRGSNKWERALLEEAGEPGNHLDSKPAIHKQMGQCFDASTMTRRIYLHAKAEETVSGR